MIDELRLLFGDSFKINDKISVNNPIIEEIKDFGEQKYFSMVSNLVAIPSDLKSVLFDSGMDYEKVSEFELFIQMADNFNINDTKIILGDLDLKRLSLFSNNQNGQIFLSESSDFLNEIMSLEDEELDKFVVSVFGEDKKHQTLDLIKKVKNNEIDNILFKRFFDENIFNVKFPKSNGIIIDMHIYMLITDYIRKMHGFEKKIELPGNEFTKSIMIELDREDRRINSKKEFKSILSPLIVALVNCADFKYDFHSVLKLPIATFMESVRQIQKLKNFNFIMNGIYSGNIDAKKINKKELNWI